MALEIGATQKGRQESSNHVYRVDKFIVPGSSREEFLSRVKITQGLLRKQLGFVRNTVLEQFFRSRRIQHCNDC